MKTNATTRVAGAAVLALALSACFSGGAMPPPPTTASTGSTWAFAESSCGGQGATAFLPGGPQAFSMGGNPIVTGCRTRCSNGEDDARLQDLATRTTKACGDGYQPACKASRTIGVETTVRKLVALSGPPRSMRSSASPATEARSWLCPSFRGPADLDKAEAIANDALKAAQADADKAAAEQKAAADRKHQLESETQGITDAAKACETKPTDCRMKCETAKDGPSCFAWGANLQSENPPKLAEARTYYQRACDAGLQSGCAAVANADKLIAEAMGSVDAAWNDIVSVGDDLAQKYHLVTVAQSVGTPRLRNALPQMRAINAAIVTEKYCPAKKTFLSASSFAIRNAPARGRAAPSTAADDFALRSANHCKSDPPMGNGLSGAQVTLTTECQQVYATPCP
jgi:hypothetical protein